MSEPLDAGIGVIADFKKMEVAAQEFQNALERCQETKNKVAELEARVPKVYSSSSAPAYMAKLKEWQADFQRVEGALARMTLELAEANKDYIRIEKESEEIANAIKAQLSG
jgi:uncharacterized protein YukE